MEVVRRVLLTFACRPAAFIIHQDGMECCCCCVAEGADVTQPTHRGSPATQPPSEPAQALSFGRV